MTDHLKIVERAGAALAGAQIGVAVTDPRVRQPAPLPSEYPAIASAIPARQTEFAAGRAAARMAMKSLGADQLPIPAGPDRAPIWPKGWSGSISHCPTFCIAAVTRAPMTVGIDIEEATELDEELISTICNEKELCSTRAESRARMAKRIFSAKEAAFKAQFPISGALFGFDHLDVAFDDTAFTATFLKPVPPFAPGDKLSGRQIAIADHLVSLVTIGQADVKGAL